MAQLLYGERIARLGVIRLACSAAVFDGSGEKLLLTRRADNGRWCLPGGGAEPGETMAEACAREVLEETGLRVRVKRLIGVYSDPGFLLAYADGRRVHVVALHFEAESCGGELVLSAETTAYGYFSRTEMTGMDVMEHHLSRIDDTFAGQSAAFVR